MQKYFFIFVICIFSLLYAQEESIEQNSQEKEEIENIEGNDFEELENEELSEIDQILNEVILLIEESDNKAALVIIEQVLELEPDNAIALFLKGMIFVRIEKVDDGIKLLQKGKELGADLSIYQLEIGRAYFLKNSYPRAIAALSTYEEESPGDSETVTLLGFSYFFVKQFANSQKYLKLAIDRNAEDKDAIHYCLALCAMNLKQRKEMLSQINSTIKDQHQSWFRKSAVELRDLNDDYKIAEAEKPWSLQFQISGGYDSNPRAFGDEIPVDVDNRYDWFVSYFLRAQYDTKINLKTKAYIKGSFFGRKYIDLAEVIDQIASEVEIGMIYEFNDTVHIKAGIRNQNYLVDYEPFANDLDFFAVLTLYETDWIYTEISYTFEYRWFFADVNDKEDELDGIYNEFEIAQAFYIQPIKATAKFGYRHLHTATEGENFDRNEGSVYFLFTGYILKENYYGLRVEYKYRDFLNDNSIDDDERRDQIYYAQIYFARKLFETLSVFFSYTYERSDSNLANFDYDRQIFTTGFTVNY